MKYSEMQNANEELLLYAGWIFQIKNPSCVKAALPFFKEYIERAKRLTENIITYEYLGKVLEKAESLT